MVENCANCAFGVKEWLHHGYRIDCHKRPPVVNVNGFLGSWDGAKQYGPKTAWPEVKDTDFCGEWELTDART